MIGKEVGADGCWKGKQMESPVGYIALSPDEVIRRCELVISEIEDIRKQEDDAMIADYVRRKKRWSFLPWWKPTPPEIAREFLMANAVYHFLLFPSMRWHRDMVDCRSMISAASATKEEMMWVSVSMHFLSRKFADGR